MTVTKYSGADVEQLRGLAQRFDMQSDRMREVAASSSIAIMTAEWTGAEVDHLRTNWSKTSRPLILRVAGELAQTAADLRRRAAEQERVSAAATGGTASSPPAVVLTTVAESPHDIRGLVDGVREVHESGSPLRIQEIVGPDGRVRLVLNIGGTRDSWEGLGGWREDVELYSRGDSPVVRAVRDQLDTQLKAHPDAEIMLVGYSQGGMVAQALAVSGRCDNLVEVVTIGSPRFDDVDFGNVNVTRLEHRADPVVNGTEYLDGSVFEDAGRDFRNWFEGRTPPNAPVDFRAGNPFENLRLEDPRANTVHDVSTRDYDWIAEQFTASTDPAVVAARERIEAFLDGTVTRSDNLPLT